jgi:hypothetical protein
MGRSRKLNWPEDVPILTADDIAWNWELADGSRDLLVWAEQTFEVVSFACYDAALKTLHAVIREHFTEKRYKSVYAFLCFTLANKRPSKAWQAACWNEMLSRLGYAVPAKARRFPTD